VLSEQGYTFAPSDILLLCCCFVAVLLVCLQHTAQFQSMLDAAKAGPKCKQLALSELPKYVGRYPELAGFHVSQNFCWYNAER